MYRTKTETKLIWWPTPQDYNEAVQTPRVSLQEPELREGLPYTNALGLPRSVTGSFASVYRMHCKNRDFALRLFLSNIHDQQERYALISNYVQNDDLPYTVTFDFLKQGIKIRGEWLPALKMDWLEGEQLDDYIVRNLSSPDQLGKLLDKFVRMMQDLHQAGIAHGDLQHGNILVCNNELRLVDYDGMFVPAMKGYTAGELGHRNYQHPNRSAEHFGPYLDNFSAWVIYASIRALQIDSRLMHQLGGGDDCLLFRQSDFTDPLNSPAFAAFERHSDSRLNELGRFVRAQLRHDLTKIPPLTTQPPKVSAHDLEPVLETAPTVKAGARIVRGNLPDWLQDDNLKVLERPGNDLAATKPKSNNGTKTTLGGMLPQITPLTSASQQSLNPVLQSWTVPNTPVQQAVWLKPGVAASSASIPGIQPPPLARSSSKLNHLTNTINMASQKKQRQMQSSQKGLAKSAASTAANSQSSLSAQVPQIPPELTTGAAKRKVTWNQSCGRMSPRDVFVLMLLNPLVWAMLNSGIQLIELQSSVAQEVIVPAVVTSVTEHPHPASRQAGGYTAVNYTYAYKGTTYNKVEIRDLGREPVSTDGKYTVAISPSYPNVTESLNSPPGEKMVESALLVLFLTVINLVSFVALLFPSLKQKRLATYGRAYIAKVDELRVVQDRIFQADISWTANGVDMYKTIKVSTDQFLTLKVGDYETILYDELADNAVFYRFCRYIAEPEKAPLKIPVNP